MTSTSDPPASTADGPRPADAVLAEADRRVAEGGVLDAIEWLSEQNRRDPQPQFERRLVMMRNEAFAAVEARPGRPSWPPPWPDRFSDRDGLVEIPATELTSDAIGAGILHHGCLLVRDLLTPGEVGELIEAIDESFAASDARNSGTPLSETATWYAPFNAPEGYSITLGERGWVRDGGGLWTADSPRALWRLTEILTRVGIGALLEEYLGERPALSVNKCTLRRVPLGTLGEWHQDGAFLGDQIRTVNVWLALTHCGDTAPGMDVVPRRIPEVLETGVDGAYFDWSVGPGTVEKAKGQEGIVRPIFEAGDALLFDERFLHRTAADPSMTQERYAVESWFFAPSHYPGDQVPLLL